jgi:hypothetical protein
MSVNWMTMNNMDSVMKDVQGTMSEALTEHDFKKSMKCTEVIQKLSEAYELMETIKED